MANELAKTTQPTEAKTEYQLLRQSLSEMVNALGEQLAPSITGIAQRLEAMAMMLQVTNERMAAIEEKIRTLEKVTPEQASELNRGIRRRAAELCEEHRMGDWITIIPEIPGKGQPAGQQHFEPDTKAMKILTSEIRKEVRMMSGTRTAREVARCDYDALMELIGSWDSWELIRKLKKEAKA